MSSILNVRQVGKSFGATRAVDGLSFDVQEGEVFCLLGPNGAGKSTTIAMIASVLPPDSGSVSFRGTAVRGRSPSYLRSLGIVPQEIALYGELSARDNLDFFAALYGLRGAAKRARVVEALRFAGLEERAADRVDTFSGGMKRRLNIACALCHAPSLLIMDEPTVGIDPQSRNHILESIRGLRDAGTTVVYTSHYMEEVEAIGDTILIMDHGAAVASGTTESLKESLGDVRRFRIELDTDAPFDEKAFFRVQGVKAVRQTGATIELDTVRGVENLDALIRVVSAANRRILGVTSVEPSLEQVFLRLTGRSLRD